MNWLIAFNEENLHLPGNEFSRISRLKSYKGWAKEAKQMAQHNKRIAKVFVISDSQYSQEACEMPADEFAKYVQRVGARVF